VSGGRRVHAWWLESTPGAIMLVVDRGGASGASDMVMLSPDEAERVALALIATLGGLDLSRLRPAVLH